MARQQFYPNDSTLNELDRLTGIDSSNNSTKNFTIGDIAEFFASTGIADPSRLSLQYVFDGGASTEPGRGKINYNAVPGVDGPVGVTTVYINRYDDRGQDSEPLARLLNGSTIKIVDTDSVNNVNYAIYLVRNISQSGDFITLGVEHIGSAGRLSIAKTSFTLISGQIEGVAGVRIYEGTDVPTQGNPLGVTNGDLFLREYPNPDDATQTLTDLYGPYNNGWGDPVRLTGATGATGPQGEVGPQGPMGDQGFSVTGVTETGGAAVGDTTTIQFTGDDPDNPNIGGPITIQPGVQGGQGPGYNNVTAGTATVTELPVTFDGVNGAADVTIDIPRGPDGAQGFSVTGVTPTGGANPGDTTTIQFTGDDPNNPDVGPQITIQPGAPGTNGTNGTNGVQGIGLTPGQTATVVTGGGPGQSTTFAFTLEDPAGTTPANVEFIVPPGAQGPAGGDADEIFAVTYQTMDGQGNTGEFLRFEIRDFTDPNNPVFVRFIYADISSLVMNVGRRTVTGPTNFNGNTPRTSITGTNALAFTDTTSVQFELTAAGELSAQIHADFESLSLTDGTNTKGAGDDVTLSNGGTTAGDVNFAFTGTGNNTLSATIVDNITTASDISALADVNNAAGIDGQILVRESGLWTPTDVTDMALTITDGNNNFSGGDTVTLNTGGTTDGDINFVLSNTGGLTASVHNIMPPAFRPFGVAANTVAEGNHTHTIEQLSDVTISSTVAAGQVIRRNAANTGWVNGSDAGVTITGMNAGGAANNVPDGGTLNLVNTSTTRGGINFHLVNGANATTKNLEGVITPLRIDDLTDVDTTTTAPTDGNFFMFDGNNWVPAAAPGGGFQIDGVNAAGDANNVVAGDILTLPHGNTDGGVVNYAITGTGTNKTLQATTQFQLHELSDVEIGADTLRMDPTEAHLLSYIANADPTMEGTWDNVELVGAGDNVTITTDFDQPGLRRIEIAVTDTGPDTNTTYDLEIPDTGRPGVGLVASDGTEIAPITFTSADTSSLTITRDPDNDHNIIFDATGGTPPATLTYNLSITPTTAEEGMIPATIQAHLERSATSDAAITAITLPTGWNHATIPAGGTTDLTLMPPSTLTHADSPYSIVATVTTTNSEPAHARANTATFTVSQVNVGFAATNTRQNISDASFPQASVISVQNGTIHSITGLPTGWTQNPATIPAAGVTSVTVTPVDTQAVGKETLRVDTRLSGADTVHTVEYDFTRTQVNFFTGLSTDAMISSVTGFTDEGSAEPANFSVRTTADNQYVYFVTDSSVTISQVMAGGVPADFVTMNVGTISGRNIYRSPFAYAGGFTFNVTITYN